ncbi:MAG: polysaccharide deacetylase [Parcubacteria group bacterium Gr01-1014_91]|nr:MAG: polysaccharide deacetylase [Parcubacteria group bacterium Gr01-1014_91]
MIIELAGMPGAGKTARANELAREHGLKIIQAPTHTVSLVTEGLMGALWRPIASYNLLALILKECNRGIRRSLFVNGWLGSSAKYWRARHGGIIDQGYAQALIGALPQSSDARRIIRVLSIFDRDFELVWCDTDQRTRAERLSERNYQPREEFGESERKRFTEEGERAYRLIRELSGKDNYPERSVSFIRRLVKTAGYLFSYFISRLEFPQTEITVLMYHSIDRSGWKLAVTPEMFERQMKYLAHNGWAVSLADVVAYAKGEKELPAHAVAVTFDDGYQHVLTVALPILERYRIPATVFLPSDMSARTSPDDRPRLTEEELRTLARSPLITIGSHAETHKKFTELAPEEMKKESVNSAEKLAGILGKRPSLFAYPFGSRSTVAETAVKDAGYEAAFGISEGTVRPGDNLFGLKRVQVDSTMSFILFRLRLTSAVDWNRRIVDLLRRA